MILQPYRCEESQPLCNTIIPNLTDMKRVNPWKSMFAGTVSTDVKEVHKALSENALGPESTESHISTLFTVCVLNVECLWILVSWYFMFQSQHCVYIHVSCRIFAHTVILRILIKLTLNQGKSQ